MLGPAKTGERRALIYSKVIWRRRVEILGQIANYRNVVRHVVARNPVATFNPLGGADRLAVLQHIVARRNRARREAMSGRHHFIHANFAAVGQAKFKTFRRFSFHHCDIVARIDDYGVVTYGRRCQC